MNNFKTSPLKSDEIMYTYKNNQDISMRIGLIGYLRMDFGKSGKEFHTTWWDKRRDINTPEFKQEFDDVINSLRENGFLSDLGTMESFCDTENVLHYPTDDHYCGVRVDTEKYTYLMRLFPYKGNYNMYCYCHIKDWLDKHIRRAKHGISICSAKDNYKEIFRLDDGDEIILAKDPDSNEFPFPTKCRYIDDYHFEAGINVYHVDQFAQQVELNGYTVIPLRASLPDRAYVFIETSPELGIVEKGKKGYYRTQITAPTKAERIAMADELNQKLGVTKAQAEAMKCGSMYGWHVPLANPQNYDDEGHLLRKAYHHG